MSDALYSPLAWELARRCNEFDIRSSPLIGATVRTYDGSKIRGVGATHDSALHDLARELDRWAARTGI